MNPFLEVKLSHLRRKKYEDNDIRDKNLPTVANSSNDSRAGTGVTKYNASKKNVHGNFPILSLESKYLES